MYAYLLTIIICLPLAGAVVCLAARESWTRPAALVSSLAALILALWAFSLFGRDASPDLAKSWERRGGLVDDALDGASVSEAVVRERFREALLAGAITSSRANELSAELAGVDVAEENVLALGAMGPDPEAEALARTQLAEARREARRLRRELLVLERDLGALRVAAQGRQRTQFKFVEHRTWIPGLGVSYALGVDGLSLALVVLVSLLGFATLIFASRPGSGENVRRRLVVLLLTQAGLLGVFCALDAVLLFAFWVLLLVPGTFLVSGDSESEGAKAGARFFLPGFLGALALLLGFGALALDPAQPTFNLLALTEHAAGGELAVPTQKLAFVCLFVGCVVRLPVIPIHGWLASAHQSAPAEFVALIHGGVLASGAYGLLRLAWPLCPDTAGHPKVALYVGLLALVNVGAGVLLLLAERDLRRAIAHAALVSSGLVLLGLAAQTPSSLAGAGLEILTAAAAGAGACLVVGALTDRTRDADLHLLGGLRRPLPYLSGLTTILLLSLAGLPGLGGFASRLLVFLGAWQSDLPPWILIAALAGAGLASAALLWILARAFLGELYRPEHARLADVRPWEAASAVPVVALCVLLGVIPRLGLDALDPALDALYALVTESL